MGPVVAFACESYGPKNSTDTPASGANVCPLTTSPVTSTTGTGETTKASPWTGPATTTMGLVSGR